MLVKWSAFLSINLNKQYCTYCGWFFLCLGRGHAAAECKLARKYRLKPSSDFHDEILYWYIWRLNHTINATEIIVNFVGYQQRVSLGIILIEVISPKCKLLIRALVASGTNRTFIIHSLARRLCVTSNSANISEKTTNSFGTQNALKVLFVVVSCHCEINHLLSKLFWVRFYSVH